MSQLIEPDTKGEAFIEQVRQTDPGEGFALWWLGQSGFLLKHAGRCLLFDPYLSESLTRKYEGTDKPHVRMTERIVDPDRLDFIDAATSTHNHTDHLDAETLKPLMRANPEMQLVIPEANRSFVADRLGCDPGWPVGLDDGASAEVAGFEFHGVPAAHEQVERDEEGRCKFLGYVVRFGRWCLYHSGDTMWYDGIVEKLKPFGVDVAILPINGRRPERRVAGNLWGDQAAELAHAIGARTVIPCHYQMFEFNTEPPDLFVDRCRELGQPCDVLRCGQRWTSDRLGSADQPLTESPR